MNGNQIFYSINNIKTTISNHKEEIEKLDQEIGDGDHIFNILRGLDEILNLKNDLLDKPVDHIFKQLGMKIIFKGKGLNQVGIDSKTNKIIIKVSKKYFREKEVDNLRANSNKIKKYLKWKPKYSIDDLISDMIKN